MQTTTTTPRTIQAAAAELTAAGYETHITRDGWLCVYGPQAAYWEAWFSPNDGNDVTVGDVPQAVFDLAYFEAKTALDALAENGSWTRNGAEALADYFGLQDAPASEIDVRFLADNWIEYPSALEASDEHGYVAPDEEDALLWLMDRTKVIPFDGGVIVVGF
jgi:hypothetical protein